MKQIHLLWLATVVALVAVIPQAQAQFGGIAKGLAGSVTAESLNGDLFGGLDFFAKAQVHFANALQPATDAAKLKALLDEAKSHDETLAAVKSANDANLKKAQEAKAKGEAFSAEATAEISKGKGEIGKGIAKWAAVGTSLGIAASKGGGDAALLAAIPTATEMIKDLPALKKMNDAINELKPLMKK